MPPETFAPKGKNGAAVYVPARGDEQLRQVLSATSQDYVLCVSSMGRVFQIAAHRIPMGNRSAKGEPLRKLLKLETGEEIVAVLPVEVYDEDRYLVTFSKLGKVKKSPLNEYKTADVDGLQDMKLANGDAVLTALLSRGQGEYFVTTNNAQTLRFSDEHVRAQGRSGQGVAAMTLGNNAQVVSAVYLDGEAVKQSANFSSLFVLTQSGVGKKVPLSQYPQKGRATAGVVTTDLAERDHVVLAMIIHEKDSLLIAWNGESGVGTDLSSSQVKVVKAAELKAFPRAKRGVPLVNGKVLSVVKL